MKSLCTRIEIVRNEGPHNLCGIISIFTNFDDADSFLIKYKCSYPESGYDKHDCHVFWENGENITLRLDLTNSDAPINIARAVKKYLLFYAGEDKPMNMNPIVYETIIANSKNRCSLILNNCDIHTDILEIKQTKRLANNLNGDLLENSVENTNE